MTVADPDRCGVCDGRFLAAETLLGPNGELIDIVQCGHCGVMGNRTGLLAEDDGGVSSVAQKQGLEDVYGWPDDHIGQQKMLDEHAVFLRAALATLAVPLTGSFLDVGCGRGLAAHAACGLFESVTATDLRPDLLEEVCRDTGRPANLTIQQGLLPTDGHYDVIWMWHVLEHLSAPRDTLTRAGSLLGEQGRIVLQVPLFRSAYVFPQHLYFYNQHTMTELATRCGLHPVSVGFDLERSFMSAVLEPVR